MYAVIRNLDYVILLCDDLERMRVFYQDVLGFPLYRELENWVELRVGACLLTLRRRGRPYDGEKLPGSAGVQLAFRVAPGEVESCYQELLARQSAAAGSSAASGSSFEIIEPPRDQDYGHRTLFFKDPEGNILEIYADL